MATSVIQPKAEGVEILTQEPPEIPVIPLNPTAQQRKDFEKATKDLIKSKSAESKEVALVVQSCFSTQQATGVLTRLTREATKSTCAFCRDFKPILRRVLPDCKRFAQFTGKDEVFPKTKCDQIHDTL